MADWHSCENCLYSDAYRVNDRGEYICKWKEMNPNDLINTSRPEITEVNYCKYFFEKAKAIDLVAENIKLKEELALLKNERCFLRGAKEILSDKLKGGLK